MHILAVRSLREERPPGLASEAGACMARMARYARLVVALDLELGRRRPAVRWPTRRAGLPASLTRAPHLLGGTT